MAKTSTGLRENVAGLLCYVLGWISGLIFIPIEKENEFVRFHAMQSIVVFGFFTVASIVIRILMLIPPLNLILLIIAWLLWLFSVVLWVILMVKAFQGGKYKLPWVGNFAEKAGLVCYVLGWISGLVFILSEKDDKFVRFHAMQSIVVFGFLTIAGIILRWIPFVAWGIGILLGILALVLWIILMVKAFQGQKYKLPWAGNFAEKQIG